MKEQDIQKAILNYIKEEGGWATKVVVTNTSGIPDILCCYKGKFVAFEVKATGKLGNVTLLQQSVLELIRESGGEAAAVDSLDMAKNILKEL